MHASLVLAKTARIGGQMSYNASHTTTHAMNSSCKDVEACALQQRGTSTKPQHSLNVHSPGNPVLDNIIVGYAFGPKKMATMGLIMAEASKALSTVIMPAIIEESSPFGQEKAYHQKYSTVGPSSELPIHFPDDTDDEDSRSFTSTRASSIASHRSTLASSRIQITFLTEEKMNSLTSAEESSTITATTLATSSSPSTSASSICHRRGGVRHPIRVSFVPIDLDVPLQEQHGGKFDVILHKMTEDILCISKLLRWKRASFSRDGCIDRPEDDKEDEIEEISKLLLSKDGVGDFEPTKHQERAARRIQRLNEYKVSRPSCVLVDSPKNILAVMSRADMAQVLSDCLEGAITKMGIPVNTPRFRVVEEGDSTNIAYLIKEMEKDRFSYPLIAKPLTAAGTKSSHHMGIVMARDGLTQLKTPCILQEFANHGGELFKVYVLGESVWVFSRESLPNLPPGENELPPEECGEKRANSYVEFERPAGSRCYVEFNSQRPYPTLSDFGIGINDIAEVFASANSQSSIKNPSEEQWQQRCKRRRVSTIPSQPNDLNPSDTHDEMNSIQFENVLANYVTKDQIEPVTNKLREAFGLELFGFDILVKHNVVKYSTDTTNSRCLDVQEILVVDVNYFPGYKEVPHFPSLLAQYLTQKAVETRRKLR